MSNTLSFYLDGTVVQAVYASISNGSVIVRDAVTFPNDELGSYLDGCRDKTCIVTCNPSAFYQDIMYFPQSAAKLYYNLIRAELMKTHPDLGNFNFNYGIIGETTADGMVKNKLAVISYADESTADIISIFHSRKKVIDSLYTAPYTIFRLALSTCDANSGLARLFIATLPGEKLVVLSEKNELEFVRKIPSPETALLASDIQSINMTMDYCFQSLRVRVTEAVMLAAPGSCEPPASFSGPFKMALPSALAGLPDDMVRDYIAPISAVLHHADSKGKNSILPSEYVIFKQHRNILTAIIVFNVSLVLLLGWFVYLEQRTLTAQKAKIQSFRSKLVSGKEELAAYKKLDNEIKSHANYLTFLNQINNSQHLGTAFANLKPPLEKDYLLKAISLKTGEGSVDVHIEGIITTASGYQETQAIFERVVEQMKQIQGYSVSSSSIDIKQKNFIIEALYKGAGQQNK
jgi:hypothetical protein